MVRQLPYRGELRYQLRLIGKSPPWNVMKATDRPGWRTIRGPVLDKARIEKVQRDGILITGPEVIPTTLGIKNIKADYFRQSWYCLPEAQPFDDQATAGDWRSDDAGQWAERYLKQSEE